MEHLSRWLEQGGEIRLLFLLWRGRWVLEITDQFILSIWKI